MSVHDSSRVLLVDDETAIAEILGRGLELRGYEVRTFSTSAAAHEAFAREPGAYDVVVTDQTMPDMSGLRLAERIHELRAGVPVVLISGHISLPDDDEVIRRAGVSEVLTKPFGLDELEAVVDRLLGGEGGR